jgi:hypothetical protein
VEALPVGHAGQAAEGREDMSDFTTTELERNVDALIAVLGAFAYPSDVDCRFAACEASTLAGSDYIECVAKAMEVHPTASAHQARWAMVMHFMEQTIRLLAQGAEPRTGILSTGAKADQLGRSPESYTSRDEDDYGSLA